MKNTRVLVLLVVVVILVLMTGCISQPTPTMPIPTINVTMKLLSDDATNIQIETNLPTGMHLEATLIGENGNYHAQASADVKNGVVVFRFGGQSGPGSYQLNVMNPVVEVQPNSLKDLLGKGSKNLTGDLVKYDAEWEAYFFDYNVNVVMR